MNTMPQSLSAPSLHISLHEAFYIFADDCMIYTGFRDLKSAVLKYIPTQQVQIMQLKPVLFRIFQLYYSN